MSKLFERYLTALHTAFMQKIISGTCHVSLPARRVKLLLIPGGVMGEAGGFAERCAGGALKHRARDAELGARSRERSRPGTFEAQQAKPMSPVPAQGRCPT